MPTPTDLIDIRRISAEPEALASPCGQDFAASWSEATNVEVASH